MRTVEIDRLAGQQMDRLAVFFSNCVVRQMQMEVQCGNVLEQAELVNLLKRGERRKLLCAFDYRRTQAVNIVDRHVERLHQRTGVLSEALLTGH